MGIYLVRHGETDGNRTRVVQVPETPLSERGRDQARRLGVRLAADGVARLLASDLVRADETARAVAAAASATVEPEPLLQERNFGDIRGTAYVDLPESPFAPHFAPPGGETWADFHARVDMAWERIRKAAEGLDGHLVVVTHGLVLHSLAVRHLELPAGVARAPDDGPPLAFGNTAVSIVDAVAPWRISLFGCTAHLAEATEGISGL